MIATRFALVTVCTSMAMVAACGGESDSDSDGGARATAPTSTTTAAPADNPSAGSVSLDVGGHKLSMTCQGSGSPTVVYLHGMGGSKGSAGRIPQLLADKQRVCAYDRPNGMGVSDPVDGPLTGNDSVKDLHALLAAADVRGPYVLLGASFGGLIADMYAATYPDDVAGMVLLDSPLPDALRYVRYVPPADRPAPDDWKESPERMDELTTFRQAQALQGKEPKIPVTIIAAKRLELPPSYPREEITAGERRLQRDFLARFSPGRLLLVDSPHFMEPAIPERIARETKPCDCGLDSAVDDSARVERRATAPRQKRKRAMRLTSLLRSGRAAGRGPSSKHA